MVGDNATRSKGVRLLRRRLQLLGFVRLRLRPMAGAAAASSWRRSSRLAGGPLSKVNNQGHKEAVCGLRLLNQRSVSGVHAVSKPYINPVNYVRAVSEAQTQLDFGTD